MFFQSKLHTGDDASVAEELLLGVSELELKCAAVSTAVSEGYFSLDKALAVYGINEMDYLAYSIFQNSEPLKNASREKMIKETLKIIVSIFSSVEKEVEASGKRTLQELQLIAEQV